MRILAKRYDTRQMTSLEIQGSRIERVLPVPAELAAQTASDVYVAPGLVDLQINGSRGQEFNDLELTAEKVEAASRSLDADGVTSYCPTLITHSFEVLQHGMKTIADACRQSDEVSRRVAGIHLEGPYVSAEDGPRGAHAREHCRPPDWDEFQRLQEAAEGRIRILTLSPEYEGAGDFIRRVADRGVVVAIGHTSATPEQIRQAGDSGATMSTHLGNGAHGQLRRHPNYIWEQLADDRLTASLIVDGHHLPAAVVQSFVRAKTPQRCILVSDITGMGGMPPGRYDTPNIGAVEVLEDGRLVVAGQRQYLAGAALPMTVGVGNVMQFADLSLAQALEMSSIRPAQLINLPVTRLEAGAPANLVLFRLQPSEASQAVNLEVVATIQSGQCVHGQLPSP